MTATPAPATSGQGAAALAAAPTATPAAAPAAPGATATPAAAPAAAAPADWIASLPEDARGYVQNKGWKDQADMLTSYQNLEKLHGVPPERIIKLPEKPDAPEWQGVWQKLGVPERPDLYKIEGVEGDDAALLGKLAHDARLTQDGLGKFMTGLREHTEAKRKAADEAFAQQSELDIKALQGEWRNTYDEQIELGRRGAKALGLDQASLGKLERVLGTKALLTMMSKIGSFGAEATAHGLNGETTRTGFGMTPEQARERISQLKADKAWVEKYIAKDAGATAEMDRLMRVAHG